MSSLPTTEDLLRAEVRELRDQLRSLTLRVDRQGDQLSEVVASCASGASFCSERGGGEESLVSEAPVEASASSLEASGVGSFSVVTGGQPELPIASLPDWQLRESVARQIGGFLRRALNGEHRGESGRRRLGGLANHYYIIVRDYHGNIYTDPVQVLTDFAEVRRLCSSGKVWGNSIFVGVPTLIEGRLATETAGFVWPARLH